MRNGLFKAIIAIGIVLGLFTSCLGDTKDTTEYSLSVAYIKSSQQTILNYALVASGNSFLPIGSTEFLTLRTGDFYFLDGFKIDWNSHTGEYYNATDVKITTDDPVPMTKMGNSIATKPTAKEANVIYPQALSRVMSSPIEGDLNDKYLFAFKCTVDKLDMPATNEAFSNNIEVVAVIYDDNQKDKIANDNVTVLPKNKVRVNLIVRRKADIGSSGQTDTYSSYAAIDLSELRQKFAAVITPGSGEDNYGWIEFEYTMDKGSNQTEEKTLGSLSSMQEAYLMAFPVTATN